MDNLANLANKYFEVWNSHDSKNVGDLFSENGILRDWEILAEGKKDIVDANQNIFNEVPNVKVEVLKMHISENTNTVSNEILVHTNHDDNEILKVVDIIEYNDDGLIKSLRAYKG